MLHPCGLSEDSRVPGVIIAGLKREGNSPQIPVSRLHEVEREDCSLFHPSETPWLQLQYLATKTEPQVQVAGLWTSMLKAHAPLRWNCHPWSCAGSLTTRTATSTAVTSGRVLQLPVVGARNPGSSIMAPTPSSLFCADIRSSTLRVKVGRNASGEQRSARHPGATSCGGESAGPRVKADAIASNPMLFHSIPHAPTVDSPQNPAVEWFATLRMFQHPGLPPTSSALVVGPPPADAGSHQQLSYPGSRLPCPRRTFFPALLRGNICCSRPAGRVEFHVCGHSIASRSLQNPCEVYFSHMSLDIPNENLEPCGDPSIRFLDHLKQWSTARMKGRGKREFPEKTRRPTTSSSTTPTCENPVTRPGIYTLFAMVGGEHANRSATAAPIILTKSKISGSSCFGDEQCRVNTRFLRRCNQNIIVSAAVKIAAAKSDCKKLRLVAAPNHHKTYSKLNARAIRKTSAADSSATAKRLGVRKSATSIRKHGEYKIEQKYKPQLDAANTILAAQNSIIEKHVLPPTGDIIKHHQFVLISFDGNQYFAIRCQMCLRQEYPEMQVLLSLDNVNPIMLYNLMKEQLHIMSTGNCFSMTMCCDDLIADIVHIKSFETDSLQSPLHLCESNKVQSLVNIMNDKLVYDCKTVYVIIDEEGNSWFRLKTSATIHTQIRRVQNREKVKPLLDAANTILAAQSSIIDKHALPPTGDIGKHYQFVFISLGGNDYYAIGCQKRLVSVRLDAIRQEYPEMQVLLSLDNINPIMLYNLMKEQWPITSIGNCFSTTMRCDDLIADIIRIKSFAKGHESRPLLTTHPHTVFINEPDLYALIMKPKMAAAEKFRNWVYENVLPSIRKYGEELA
ncbi:hypothetical protein PR048_013872 [Dryococelus australis]|uniref:Bro-N domain-containing protein n=1 Tax=Dryococelus australis TaxID=614101 RepID=A0ABQ9HTE5_9NEOP|nr:hypothetical protein PR048_013872 [Dryococelus australis]